MQLVEISELHCAVQPVFVDEVPSNFMYFDPRDTYDYGSDYGLESEYFDDGNEYFGDFGNYDNYYDTFDGYSGVDSGVFTQWTAPHEATAENPSTYLVYSQSSGIITKTVRGVTSQLGEGYSGNEIFYNVPEADHLKNEGPIPKGEYTLTSVDNHKGPLTIDLSPAATNDMHGRNNFLIHGDNASRDHTASEGCIILDRATRQTLIDSGIVTLYVTR